MKLLEIYQAVDCAIPAELREKYGHLSYAEMAEIPELEPWAEALRRAEDDWNRAASNEAWA